MAALACAVAAPPAPARGPDAGGTLHSIVMGSDETLVHSRAEWHAIPVFGIVVERYTEDI